VLLPVSRAKRGLGSHDRGNRKHHAYIEVLAILTIVRFRRRPDGPASPAAASSVRLRYSVAPL